MDRWMNLPVLELELVWLDWLLLNISEMKKEKMSYCSLTISSDSLKLVQKCLLCWEEFLLLSDINPLLPLILEHCRKESLLLKKDPSLLFKLSMYQLMILLILLLPLLSPIWMLLLCWIEHWLNWVFILLWILLTLLRECWTQSSLERNTIK